MAFNQNLYGENEIGFLLSEPHCCAQWRRNIGSEGGSRVSLISKSWIFYAFSLFVTLEPTAAASSEHELKLKKWQRFTKRTPRWLVTGRASGLCRSECAGGRPGEAWGGLLAFTLRPKRPTGRMPRPVYQDGSMSGSTPGNNNQTQLQKGWFS